MAENKEYDQKELEAGIKIESEHKDVYNFFKSFCDKHNLEMPITDTEMYKMIAKSHLKEISDYYTRLKKMEKEADKKLKASSNNPIFDTGNSICFLNK